jgi:hypothetical protein
MRGEQAGDATKMERAIDLLEECLSRGPMRRADILKEAKVFEISASTIDRAKKKIGVVSGDERDLKELTWRLPASNAGLPQGAESPAADHPPAQTADTAKIRKGLRRRQRDREREAADRVEWTEKAREAAEQGLSTRQYAKV